MIVENHFTLINPVNGNLAFKIAPFDCGTFDHIQRFNYYSIVWIRKGNTLLKTNFSEHELPENTMMFFSPYQPFMLEQKENLSGVMMHFHSDFFCIHKHDKEVSCNGILFNNIYQPPFITLKDEDSVSNFESILQQIKKEIQTEDISKHDLLVSLLKIFLINAVRIKATQNPELAKAFSDDKEPFILQKLKDEIEENFRKKHAPSQYADLLKVTPKLLSKISKKHFNKTLTDLIAERIVVEAKRDLYLTDKSVKAIAHELGFSDEYHFSRYFKNQADVSPQLYRETTCLTKS
ncbi:MAG: helix-turn-helix transcriptional regulator [Bacteroidota bacterium]|nr:helix-turn-helix transcriptional regulator [Bacteroidota bacterium]